MCTAITLQNIQKQNFFGRNMDFSYLIKPHLYIVPQNYKWVNMTNGKQIKNKYRFMAIGEEKDNILGFFDGVNEKGFAIATLFFANYASYCDPLNYSGKDPIATLDFVHYALGQCESVVDFAKLLTTIALIGLADPITESVAPLHWIATDQSGKCVVVEHTKRGLELYSNSIGVMTNSPEFPWQMTNLRNYVEVSPYQTKEVTWGDIKLQPFGQGAGTFPLPGGLTSPERFVRTSYRKTHISIPRSATEGVISCFHILEGVSIPKGVIVTEHDRYDYTKYTCVMNTRTCDYYFRTYDNSQIATVGLFDRNMDARDVVDIGALSRPVVFQSL